MNWRDYIAHELDYIDVFSEFETSETVEDTQLMEVTEDED